MEAQTRNSPKGPETERPEPASQWRRVGVRDISVYLPWNAPVEALGRTLAFGEVTSGDGDVQSIQTRAIKPADATQIVRLPRKKVKPPDLPS